MYIASVSLPTEQADGSIKLVRKDHKLGKMADDKSAFAYAQRTFNPHGGKVHRVTCISAKGKGEEKAGE